MRRSDGSQKEDSDAWSDDIQRGEEGAWEAKENEQHHRIGKLGLEGTNMDETQVQWGQDEEQQQRGEEMKLTFNEWYQVASSGERKVCGNTQDRSSSRVEFWNSAKAQGQQAKHRGTSGTKAGQEEVDEL